MIRFTHIHVGKNSYACIPSSLDVGLSQDQQWFVLNLCSEYLNSKDLALTAVGKGNKKKTAKRKLDILRGITAWSGLANSKERINILKGDLELTGTFGRVSRMYQAQRIKKKCKLLAAMMDLAPKTAQKLLCRGGELKQATCYRTQVNSSLVLL